MKRFLWWILTINLGFTAIGGVLGGFGIDGQPPNIGAPIIGLFAGWLAWLTSRPARGIVRRPGEDGRPVPRRYVERRPWERGGQ